MTDTRGNIIHPADANPGAVQSPAGQGQRYVPRLIAWETTRACPLACRHCRAAAQPTGDADELTTAEAQAMLQGIAAVARPTIILTGGEPMLRDDVYHLAAYGRKLGLRMVMAPCGLLLNDESAGRIVAAGIEHISISIDGRDAASHDAFRGVPGAFDAALRGIEAARRAGLLFQINTTITRHNVDELPQILQLAVRLGASTFNPFLLVPTGRGRLIADEEISPERYEETLKWLAGEQGRSDIAIRVTCAPHYQRILRQSGRADISEQAPKGCLGGKSFAFISSRGKVQICGFLDIECGDLRAAKFNFAKVWNESDVLRRIRQVDNYGGRCGRCEFRHVCGGCRARAFALTGDYLAEEPFCVHQPHANRSNMANASPAPDVSPAPELSDLDRRILSEIQLHLPLTLRPFDQLADNLAADSHHVMSRVEAMKASGLIRRVGAIFDSRRLGYYSTLVAGRVDPKKLDQLAERVSALPGVTHNYQRHHQWNLWFTLTQRSEADIRRKLDELASSCGDAGSVELHSLPALKVYKIRAVFNLGNCRDAAADGSAATTAEATTPTCDSLTTNSAEPVCLDERQRRLVRLLQADVPLCDEPFAAIGGQVGWSAEAVVEQIRQWLAAGVVRRFGGVVRHHQLGFTANAMAVFALDERGIDEAGRLLARCDAVSHCYRRAAFPGWPYELFAMLHGRSTDEVKRRAELLAQEIGATQWELLFSAREFKKESMHYFADEADAAGEGDEL